MAERIKAFKNEIELRWPNYFKSKKITIPNKNYAVLKAKRMGTTSDGKATPYLAIQNIITQVCNHYGICIEVDNKQSNSAINQLFFKEILSLYVTSTLSVTHQFPEEVQEFINQLPNELSSLEKQTVLSVLDIFDEKIAHNENGTFRYFTSQRKREAVILINALGMSINLWSNMIQTLKDQYQVIVWENRCGDIEQGGMEAVVTIDEHAADIETVIETEQLENAHIIAWCNGTRIGIKVASENSNIGKLVLLGPSFKGINHNSNEDSLFERQMDNLFEQVRANPSNADPLAKFFKKALERKLSLDSISGDELLGLNNEILKPMVFYHLCQGEYLLNHEKRVKNDHFYNIDACLGKLNKKVLFVLGENDNVVSNDLVKQVSNRFFDRVVFTVSGGSHYMHIQNTELIHDIIVRFLTDYKDYEFLSNRLNKVPQLSFVI